MMSDLNRTTSCTCPQLRPQKPSVCLQCLELMSEHFFPASAVESNPIITMCRAIIIVITTRQCLNTTGTNHCTFNLQLIPSSLSLFLHFFHFNPASQGRCLFLRTIWHYINKVKLNLYVTLEFISLVKPCATWSDANAQLPWRWDIDYQSTMSRHSGVWNEFCLYHHVHRTASSSTYIWIMNSSFFNGRERFRTSKCNTLQVFSTF